MSEVKHTHGPLEIVNGAFHAVIFQKTEKGRKIFAELPFKTENGCQTDYDEVQDKAHLIAAAPDLLSACKAVFDDVASIDTDSCLSLEVGRALKAAIAKAEGKQ